MSFIQYLKNACRCCTYHKQPEGVSTLQENQIHFIQNKGCSLDCRWCNQFPSMFLGVTEKRLFCVLFAINGGIANKIHKIMKGKQHLWSMNDLMLISDASDILHLGMIWSFSCDNVTINTWQAKTHNINGNQHVHCSKTWAVTGNKAAFSPNYWIGSLRCQSVW